MTLYRGPGGTGSASSDADTTLYQEFLTQTQAARDAALQAETNAELAEANAEAAEAGVAASAAAAASSASAAASSASSSSTSATNAASSASSASTSASNAASSASSASSSASAASTSATNAASSATAAASSASAASTSATNAANSATSASNSASTATTQATNAASSATAAASSATAAQSAQTAAEAARDAALSAYDNFDDRYLGPKASDPSLDNDGNALIAGALYFNTVTNVMKVYDGSTWVAAYVSAAGVLLAVNNLSDLSNTATARANLNVPTRTGGDASGTWGINVTGNAATVTNGVYTTGDQTIAGTKTFSSNPVLSAGTVNGLAFLNASKVLTTGSALTFDGSTFNVSGTSRVYGGAGVFIQGTLAGGSPFLTGGALELGADSTTATIQAFTRNGFTAYDLKYNTTTNHIWSLASAEQMRLTSTGLGIGTSSMLGVSDRLAVVGGNVAVQRTSGITTILGDNTQRGYVGTISNHTLSFLTNSTEQMFLTAAGNLGIGTSSPTDGLLHLNGGTTTNIKFTNTSTGTTASDGFYVGLGPSNDATAFIYQRENSAIAFGTNNVERARIDSSGNLLVGRSSQISGERFVVEGATTGWFTRFRNTQASGGAQGLEITYTSQAPNGTDAPFLFCQDNAALRMSVRSNGGIANFQANNVNLSDRREKTNFAPAGEYLSKICAIPVQTFNYIDQNLEEDAGLTLGVVAQDVQAVAPELVSESNWGTEEEPKMRLSIYQTDLQYALMKSIQELKTELDSVKAELATLKGN